MTVSHKGTCVCVEKPLGWNLCGQVAMLSQLDTQIRSDCCFFPPSENISSHRRLHKQYQHRFSISITIDCMRFEISSRLY